MPLLGSLWRWPLFGKIQLCGGRIIPPKRSGATVSAKAMAYQIPVRMFTQTLENHRIEQQTRHRDYSSKRSRWLVLGAFV